MRRKGANSSSLANLRLKERYLRQIASTTAWQDDVILCTTGLFPTSR